MSAVIVIARETHLPSIITLWRSNNKTLGFFPEGAFIDHVRQGHILVVEDHGQAVGYLTYRVSRDRASIAHLCIDREHRGRGLARILFQQLLHDVGGLEGISVRCRPEYDAAKMWPRFGFSAIREMKGRGTVPARLDVWWYAIRKPLLFADVDAVDDGRLQAVLDANTVFAIDENNAEVEGLLEGWVQDDVQFMVTDELFNEIHRCPDDAKRRRSRQTALTFDRVDVPPQQWQTVLPRICAILPPASTSSDESDRRQLAHTIAGDANLFVTKDEILLSHTEEFEEVFNLKIVRPVDVPMMLDELLQRAKYQPARLAGPDIEVRRIRSGELTDIARQFLDTGRGEKLNHLLTRWRQTLAKPDKTASWIVCGNSGILAVCIIDSNKPDRHEVVALRVARGPLESTLARFLVLDTVQRLSGQPDSVTYLADDHASQEARIAAAEMGFIGNQAEPAKLCGRVIGHTCDILSGASRIRRSMGHTHEAEWLNRAANDQASVSERTPTLLAIERHLWPAKFADLSIPTYIVPVQPRWAVHLFDPRQADDQLFGAFTPVVLSGEKVYYRKSHPPRLEAPARILWYVSKQTHAIKACSYLDEVVIGKPKQVFGQFKRLGIFEWREVYEVADRSLDSDIMAFVFSGTELFEHPIDWADVQNHIVAERGKRNPLVSPLQMSQEFFANIYRRGFPEAKGAYL